MGKGKEGVLQGRVGQPFFSYIPVLFVQYLYLELVFVVEFKIENKWKTWPLEMRQILVASI